ncbi:MAG: DUF1214 domain-containing protein [Alphaproteobacteria bacterium]
MSSFVRFVVFIALGIALGLGSAWYVLDQGLSFDVLRIGPWVARSDAGQPLADPYTGAFIAKSGHVPLRREEALYFFAKTDDAGDTLRADCRYDLSGKNLSAAWWAISVHRPDGDLIANPAHRYSFSQTTLLFDDQGTYRITISPTAVPGNWIPTGGGGDIVLVLRLHGPNPDYIKDQTSVGVPTISTGACQ